MVEGGSEKDDRGKKKKLTQIFDDDDRELTAIQGGYPFFSFSAKLWRLT